MQLSAHLYLEYRGERRALNGHSYKHNICHGQRLSTRVQPGWKLWKRPCGQEGDPGDRRVCQLQQNCGKGFDGHGNVFTTPYVGCVTIFASALHPSLYCVYGGNSGKVGGTIGDCLWPFATFCLSTVFGVIGNFKCNVNS